MDSRRLIATLLFGALSGCATASEGVVAPAEAPAPEVVEPAPDTTPPPAPVEPELPLEERWSAPFAVRSSGSVPVRAPRSAAVRLRPDTTLPVAARTEPPADTAAAPEPAKATPRTHVVVRGDTLYGIARRYGVRPEEIRAANRMESDVVRIGQKLVIPTGD